MRQLMVQVPRGQGERVSEIVRRHDAVSPVCVSGQAPEGPVDLIVVELANRAVGDALADLQKIDPLRVTLIPHGVLPLRPPPEEAADQVADVTARSPLEVFLAGIQSVGSWRGFLGYAASAGGVVWIGLFTNTIYLLTAAMLIAPYAGPAMNASLATARGDWRLLLRSLGRYVAAIAVTVVVAALLSLVMQQNVATAQMIRTSQLSSIAVLLPLIAGAAGALNLVQSERSSLVTGAATGMLVAASLAPPAGLVGMATVLGDRAMALSGLFVLLLQIAGINLSGALVFRAFGVRPSGSRYERGRRGVFPVTLAATAAWLAVLLTVQFWESPHLEQSTRQQRARAAIEQVLQQSQAAALVDADVRFTGADIPGQHSLLVLVYAQARQRLENADAAEELRQQLTQLIRRTLAQQGFRVTPLVDVTVFDAP